MILLRITAGPDAGKYYQVAEGFTLLFGRGRHADTQLTDQKVSRVHCEVAMREGRITATDLDSNGGTFVNGHRIMEQQLKNGDVLRLGDTEMTLEGMPEAAPAAAAPAAAAPKSGGLSGDGLGKLTGRHVSHYRLGAVIAQGQSGVVFRARDLKNNIDVAVKVFSADFGRSDEDVQRFVRAMKTMLPHRHPHLVAIHGAGKSGFHCWVAMELVDGVSLREIIERLGLTKQADWRFGLRVAHHIAQALAYAHGQGIVHRNLTPTNILVTHADKSAKLGDLMLAKAMESSLAEQVTKPGQLLGDVRYIAPERAQGTSALDARSDIYGLGASVYSLMTGMPPFDGATFIEILQQVRKEAPLRPKVLNPALPDAVEKALLKMMAKNPDDRYASAAILMQELEGLAREVAAGT